MNKLSLKQGRIEQKLKTRAVLLKAARSLMKRKKKITLENVAEKAKVSRATIYRYFPNMDLLVKEASLDIAHSTPGSISDSVMKYGLKDRLIKIQERYNKLAQEHETEFRRYISAAIVEGITSKKKLRGARRVEALTLALVDQKGALKKSDRTKLIHTAALLMGIDALVVCKDVCDLSNEEADKTLKWAIETILKGLTTGSKN